MDFGTLFTEQRWSIIEALSSGSYSPMQLAEISNTTMANISQQLRLLEMSNLVKKEKVKNRDKGKPRSLFSLSSDTAYLVSATKGFADKKLVKLDKFHNMLVRTWFLDDSNFSYFSERFLWSIEKYVDLVDLIVMKFSENKTQVLISSKNSNDLKGKVNDIIIKKSSSQSMIFKIEIMSLDDAKKSVKLHKGFFSNINQLNVIYDPEIIIGNIVPKGDDT